MKLKQVKVGNYYVFNSPGHEDHGHSCRVISIDSKGTIEIAIGHFSMSVYKVTSGQLC